MAIPSRIKNQVDALLLGEAFAGELAQCADIETAWVRLEMFFERCEDATGQCARIAAEPLYGRMLLRIFDQSQFLTDILLRRPGLAEWMAEPGRFNEPLDKEVLLEEALRDAAPAQKAQDWWRTLRLLRQREILRIGLRDIFAHEPLPSVAEDLANLADVCLEACYQLARKELVERFGEPRRLGEPERPSEFTIFGMGKLGGRELNFSSDVDLIFIYDEDGETDGARSASISNGEFYSKLGEQIVRAMGEPTAEGYIFRVDMRLRPHGHMAPLAVNIDHALEYYERYGLAWERQALIKIRACAGSPALGEEFIRTTRHFAFPPFFDDATLEDVMDMKLQMEKKVASRGETDLEVKLGRGGIRDIEFTVQVLQLLNGGRSPALRTSRTLDAIEQLGAIGELGPLEASTLSSNYIFLRQVEHRLQLEGNQQIHVMPKEPKAFNNLAMKLGYASGDAFMREYLSRAEETRGILERFLAAKGDGTLWVSDLLNARSDGEEGIERLRAMGFTDPVASREVLLTLCNGTPETPHPVHARQQFTQVAPALIEALAKVPRPDRGLSRFADVLSTIKAPRAIYEILRFNPGLCERLATLIANSAFLTNLLVRDPGLFDLLGSSQTLEIPLTEESLDEQLAALRRAHDEDAALYRLRDGETLRVGIRDLFGDVGAETVGQELTLIADCCLRDCLHTARVRTEERYGACNLGYTILGLGKAGGHELGYGSDLDLVFVCESGTTESGMGSVEYFTDMTQRAIKLLHERTRYGTLYEIDARLRPDGNQGVLVVSEQRFREYYEGTAESWERLALVKARAMAGDMEFGRHIEGIAHELAYSLRLDAAAIDRIVDIGARLAEKADALDVKKQNGGIAQIEWAVRLLQIQHSTAHVNLRRSDFMGALDLLTRHRLLSEEKASALRDAYTLMRRIENRIRMMDGRSGSSLPESDEARGDLAARLGMEGDLAAMVAASQARASAIYQEVIAGLRAGG